MIEKEEMIVESKKFFEEYKKDIGKYLREEKDVVNIDFMKLAEFSNIISKNIIENTEETLGLIELALEETWSIKNIRVRLFNLPETMQIKIRNIRSKHLHELIVIEGIIRQASNVRPQVVEVKFECPSCGSTISVLQLEKKLREPSKCSCGRRGGFKKISDIMVDTQRLVIEESPESLSGGEQPKRIDVFLKEDLVDERMEKNIILGNKIKIIGILKEVPLPSKTGGVLTRFDLAIESNNLISMEETFEELDINEDDEEQIIELSQNPEIFENLAKSIAPSVFGYEDIKKSLVLQLFGGVRKIHVDGQKSRGDIHILLVGDPGIAKSVILNFIADISPKGRYVVGKSASGPGITATVVRDEYLRGWTLEAGAMVLSNKGIVCIDELEKMDYNDRSAMHEAMEQQGITISKANVQARLRCETSVLAAANPSYGVFDKHQSVSKQIDLPPTLINRFDVIFTLRDIPDNKKDDLIATHILNEHRENGKDMIIPREIFRKYVAYAKQKIKPKLSKEASEEIKNFYLKLRNENSVVEGFKYDIPISPRQLQALIRMSEASAKIRLSEEVKKEDAKNAIKIMEKYFRNIGIIIDEKVKYEKIKYLD